MKFLLYFAPLAALTGLTFWLVTAFASPRPADVTTFYWPFTPGSTSDSHWTVKGRLSLQGNPSCFECFNSPNFCQNPPMDYGTRWLAKDMFLGVALALPGSTLKRITPTSCPTSNLMSQENDGHMVGKSPIHFTGEDQWFPVNWDEPLTWDWLAGGDTSLSEDSGTIVLSQPKDTGGFRRKPGTPPNLWYMEISTGFNWNLQWTGCAHKYFVDKLFDRVEIVVEII